MHSSFAYRDSGCFEEMQVNDKTISNIHLFVCLFVVLFRFFSFSFQCITILLGFAAHILYLIGYPLAKIFVQMKLFIFFDGFLF